MFLRLLIALLRLKSKLAGGRSLLSHEIRSLVIVELTRMGDVIAMLPSIRLLAEQFSRAEITLLIDERYAELVRSFGVSCRVVGVKGPETVSGLFEAIQLARVIDADMALSMSPPKRNAVTVLASGAKRKVGYLTYVDSLTPYLRSTPIEAFACTLARREFYGLENIEERALKVCKSLGIVSEVVNSVQNIDKVRHAEAQRRLQEKGVFLPKRFIVLHPFSGWRFRSWSVDRFNQLATKILTQLNIGVVYLCEKSEERLLDASKSRFNGRDDVFFLASDDLVETSVVLKEALLIVCNDSGPLHLASALGVQAVGLFGPASPALTAPKGVRGVVHYERVPCSPCDQRQCVRPTDSCMSLISPDAVFQSVLKYLPATPVAETVADA